MLTSFIKNLRSWSLHFINTFAMGLENVFVAFFNLNGITFHSKNLVLMTTTIIQTSSSAILICQKPNYRSKAENHENFTGCVIRSSMKGMGKESCLVLSIQRSIVTTESPISIFLYQKHEFASIFKHVFVHLSQLHNCLYLSVHLDPFPKG